MPTRTAAILIVNGFDRGNRSGTYDCDEATKFPWIRICLEQIRRHSKESAYEVYLYDNALLDEHREAFSAVPSARIFTTPASLPGPPVELAHPEALDFVLEEVGNACEYFICLDSDAFPIRDGWIEALTNRIENGCDIVGVYRDEMKETISPFVHVSCLCMRTRDFRALATPFNGPRRDVGHNITTRLKELGGTFGLLRRTNARNEHFLMAGVYGNLVYHHGAGSRRATFWTSATEDDEAARKRLRDRVFDDLEGFVGELLDADYADLPAVSVEVVNDPVEPRRRLSPSR